MQARVREAGGTFEAGRRPRGPGRGSAYPPARTRLRRPGGGDRMIRIVLADDHPVVREGIRGMLQSLRRHRGGRARRGSGPEAVALVAELHPDLVLMDLRMPGGDGVEATRTIAAAHPPTRVVVLTTYETDQDILRAIEAGASGYLLKMVAGEALADDLGVLVDENGHYLEPFTALTTFCGGVGEIVGGGDGEARFGQDFLAQFDIGAFQAHHQRHLQRDFLRRGDDAFGDDVAFHDAAEDVDQDALHIGIADDDLEGLRDLFLGRAAADIQEVGGLAADTA